MHVIIGPDKIASPESYPDWCGLGWFQNYRGLTAPVEPHYHDLPEIYLWHEGKGKALIDNKPVDMRPGVMAYTETGAEHSITPAGKHSNTGLMPKPFAGCRGGHLHRDETGESPVPKHSSLFVMPEENSLIAPYELPSHCFVRHVISARLSNGDAGIKRRTEAWTAILVREGRISVLTDDNTLDLEENHLVIISAGVDMQIASMGDSEIAMAEGWPDG